LLLDHDGHLPSFAVVTEGKQHEVRVARQLHLAPGTIVAIDRGYTDYEWFADLTKEGVYFVTRLKDNADYGVVEERELPQRKGLRRDQVIFFYKLAQAGADCFFRRVEYYDEETDEVLVFLTNHMALAAATVAAVYKDRWAIELFLDSSTWCTPSYVMEFQDAVAWNRALVGWRHGPVRPCIARHLLCA
jgi:IS4 transposase